MYCTVGVCLTPNIDLSPMNSQYAVSTPFLSPAIIADSSMDT